MSRLTAWILAFRPKTLTAALIPIVVGSALASQHPHGWQLWVSVCALLSALFIQIATNLFNDAIDFKKGADNANRLGPKRVTQSGMIESRQVMWAGFFCLLLALGFGLPLVVRGGWPIIGIGVVSLALAYAYTGGPFPLAYRGLGDLFVFVFFGLIAVSGVVYLQVGEWTLESFVAGAQVGLLSTVLIAINNYRDFEEDRKVGKLTLAARFGGRFAQAEILLLLAVSYMLGLFWWTKSFEAAAWMPLLSLPVAAEVARGVIRLPPSQALNRYLARAAGTQLLFGGLLSLGFLL